MWRRRSSRRSSSAPQIDEGERKEDSELGRAERCGREGRLERRRVDDGRGEGELEEEAPQQQRVREQPDRAQRRALGARGERRADLAGDDRRGRSSSSPGGRRGGAGSPADDGSPGRPAGPQRARRRRRPWPSAGRDHAEEEPGPHEHRPADHALGARPRRPLHRCPARQARGRERARAASPCRGRSRGSAAPSAAAGSAPPESAKTRNGTTSGVACAKM